MPSFDPLIIDPGTLRHSISIQAATTTRDAAGQPSATWANVLTTRASIESTTTIAYKSSFSGNALASEATDVVTLRWPGPDVIIEPSQRMIFQDNTYLIQAVDNVKRRNRVLRLACMVIDGDSN